MSRTRYIVLISLICAQGVPGQINTEAMRSKAPAPGWGGQASIDLSWMAGNTEHRNLRGAARADHHSDRGYAFGVLQYQEGRKGASRYTNKGFLHLRMSRLLRDDLWLEGFAQWQYDEFIRLADRKLLGGGMRKKWDAAQQYRLYFGTGLMLEAEEMSGSAEITNLLRSSSYLVQSWMVDDRLALHSTVYYQVDTQRVADYRLLSETRFTFQLSRKIAYRVTANYRYDSEPPEKVKRYDMELLNGIEIRL